MATVIDAPPDGALAEVKAYLRIEQADEDAVLGTLIGAGLGLCERFTGLTLLSGERGAVLGAAPCVWQRLPATPVSLIEGVSALGLGGSAGALAVGGYAIDIDASGDGWVRLTAPIDATRIQVAYRAGLSPDWAGLPAVIRQGLVRLVAHLHAHRDAADEAGPPAAVTALWRPWRRMRLS